MEWTVVLAGPANDSYQGMPSGLPLNAGIGVSRPWGATATIPASANPAAEAVELDRSAIGLEALS